MSASAPVVGKLIPLFATVKPRSCCECVLTVPFGIPPLASSVKIRQTRRIDSSPYDTPLIRGALLHYGLICTVPPTLYVWRIFVRISSLTSFGEFGCLDLCVMNSSRPTRFQSVTVCSDACGEPFSLGSMPSRAIDYIVQKRMDSQAFGG